MDDSQRKYEKLTNLPIAGNKRNIDQILEKGESSNLTDTKKRNPSLDAAQNLKDLTSSPNLSEKVSIGDAKFGLQVLEHLKGQSSLSTDTAPKQSSGDSEYRVEETASNSQEAHIEKTSPKEISVNPTDIPFDQIDTPTLEKAADRVIKNWDNDLEVTGLKKLEYVMTVKDLKSKNLLGQKSLLQQMLQNSESDTKDKDVIKAFARAVVEIRIDQMIIADTTNELSPDKTINNSDPFLIKLNTDKFTKQTILNRFDALKSSLSPHNAVQEFTEHEDIKPFFDYLSKNYHRIKEEHVLSAGRTTDLKPTPTPKEISVQPTDIPFAQIDISSAAEGAIEDLQAEYQNANTSNKYECIQAIKVLSSAEKPEELWKQMLQDSEPGNINDIATKALANTVVRNRITEISLKILDKHADKPIEEGNLDRICRQELDSNEVTKHIMQIRLNKAIFNIINPQNDTFNQNNQNIQKQAFETFNNDPSAKQQAFEKVHNDPDAKQQAFQMFTEDKTVNSMLEQLHENFQRVKLAEHTQPINALIDEPPTELLDLLRTNYEVQTIGTFSTAIEALNSPQVRVQLDQIIDKMLPMYHNKRPNPREYHSELYSNNTLKPIMEFFFEQFKERVHVPESSAESITKFANNEIAKPIFEHLRENFQIKSLIPDITTDNIQNNIKPNVASRVLKKLSFMIKSPSTHIFDTPLLKNAKDHIEQINNNLINNSDNQPNNPSGAFEQLQDLIKIDNYYVLNI